MFYFSLNLKTRHHLKTGIYYYSRSSYTPDTIQKSESKWLTGLIFKWSILYIKKFLFNIEQSRLGTFGKLTSKNLSCVQMFPDFGCLHYSGDLKSGRIRFSDGPFCLEPGIPKPNHSKTGYSSGFRMVQTRLD
jgi:hypothetical protein